MLSVSETGLPATMSASIIHNCRIRLSLCFSICKQTVCFFLALLWFWKRGQYRSQILSCTQTSWNHLAPKSKPAGVNKDLLANPCKLIILLHRLRGPASVALTTTLQDPLPNLGYAPVLVSGRNLAIPWAIDTVIAAGLTPASTATVGTTIAIAAIVAVVTSTIATAAIVVVALALHLCLDKLETPRMPWSNSMPCQP